MEKRRKIDDDQYIKIAVYETLTLLGFNVSNPHEIQQDIAWLRLIRKRSEAIGEKALYITVTSVVGGLLYSLWLGIKKSVSL